MSWPMCVRPIRMYVANTAKTVWECAYCTLKFKGWIRGQSEAGSLAYCYLGPGYRGFAGPISML